MNRITLQVGLYGVNCSIVIRGNRALIVDPGSDADAIIRHLADRQLQPEAIVLTHAHFDHIGGIPALQARFPGLPVYAHPADYPAFGHPMNQTPDYPPVAKPANLLDVRTLADVTVIETPGHTPGGVCLYFQEDNTLFSGDSLFAGSVGRTDFPGGGGDMATLLDSLQKLLALPDDTLVIPGHGPFTTIGDERKHNPFIRT